MPMHDWTRVDAGIYHDFHHEWISEIKRALNRGLLPPDYYALAEQVAAGFGPDVTSLVAVRHVSGDHIVAMIEIVSPGNKTNANAFRAFVQKARELLDQRIHLLVLDPFPSGCRDPNSIHSAIWEQFTDEPFELPPEKSLTMIAYEVGITPTAYIETIAVGDALTDMPLFLAPKFYVPVPLEAAYQAAWDTVPARWQRVIASGP